MAKMQIDQLAVSCASESFLSLSGAAEFGASVLEVPIFFHPKPKLRKKAKAAAATG